MVCFLWRRTRSARYVHDALTASSHTQAGLRSSLLQRSVSLVIARTCLGTEACWSSGRSDQRSGHARWTVEECGRPRRRAWDFRSRSSRGCRKPLIPPARRRCQLSVSFSPRSNPIVLVMYVRRGEENVESGEAMAIV
jgi:hypothetical protein